MPYSEDSSHSPIGNGELTQANVSRVSNNPYNPNNDVNWPTQYDAFVTKTNDQMSSVNVTESHEVTDISAANLYLQHRPRLNASITVTNGGVVSNVDYNNGVITFSANPAGPFTVSYLADPDKYYGEYLTQLQDGIHELQAWAGAGSVQHEGIKNANYALLSTGGNLAARLPYATNLSALQSSESVSIKSDTGVTDNTITLGNGDDQIIVDSDDVDLTLNSTDRVNVRGKLVVAEEGTSVSLDSGSVGHAANASSYSDTASDVAVFYGDVKIFGDILTDGSITTNTNTTATNVLAQDLQVDGNTILGDSTADTTTASGPLAAGDTLTVAGDATFNGNINLASGSTVDGVDLAALATQLDYIRPGGPDWKDDSINITHFTTKAFNNNTGTGVEDIGFSGTVTSVTIGGTLITDSSATSGAYPTNTTNETTPDSTDVYTDGTWLLKFTSGTRAGEVFSVLSGPNTSTNQWTLDRVCDGTVGASYTVYSPYRNIPNHLSNVGLTVSISASTVNPVVATVDGKKHVITDSSISITMPSTNGGYYIYMRNSGSTVELFHNQTFIQPKGAVFVGYVSVTSGTISSSGLRAARPNQKFDSGWISLTAGNNQELSHILGANTATGLVKVLVNTADVTQVPGMFDYTAEASASDVVIEGTSAFFTRLDVITTGYYRIIVSRQ